MVNWSWFPWEDRVRVGIKVMAGCLDRQANDVVVGEAGLGRVSDVGTTGLPGPVAKGKVLRVLLTKLVRRNDIRKVMTEAEVGYGHARVSESVAKPVSRSVAAN